MSCHGMDFETVEMLLACDADHCSGGVRMRKISYVVLISLLVFGAGACSRRKSSDDPLAGIFRFDPSSAQALPGETINFSLLNGIPPYQLGFEDTGDLQSYDDISEVVAYLNADNGVGSYTVGPNNNCSDRLAAQDSTGASCFLEITVGDGGDITGGDTGHDAGSGFFTVKDMFDYLNYEREMYSGTGGHGTAPHGGYDGYPWEGQGLPESQPYTWSITFAWDSELAEEAQTEAERLRDGGSTQGRRFSHQGYGGEPMWLLGLDSPKYMASGLSEADTAAYPWWKNNNGTARMALHYQTGTAPNNHKTRIGIGKADTGVNDVWWVFIYGEAK